MSPNPSASVVATLPPVTRQELAAEHQVSRKFLYQQGHKAKSVLEETFAPTIPDDEIFQGSQPVLAGLCY